MILTCPACSTKYVVKDGAIPPGGRQVRCAACKHSWHQDPEGEAAVAAAAAEDSTTVDAPLAQAPTEALPPVGPAEPAMEPESIPDDRAAEAVAPPEQVGDSEPAMPPERDQWIPAPGTDFRDLEESAPAEDFDPFYDHEPIERPRRRVPLLVWLLLAVAAAAVAFWFLAPDSLRQRLGIAGLGETPLLVMLSPTTTRQSLASGNELFVVAGRVINPTDRSQRVPPLRAELLDASKSRVVYSWTIAPPTPILAPGSSASFNSAEMDVPKGGSHLRVMLGDASS